MQLTSVYQHNFFYEFMDLNSGSFCAVLYVYSKNEMTKIASKICLWKPAILCKFKLFNHDAKVTIRKVSGDARAIHPWHLQITGFLIIIIIVLVLACANRCSYNCTYIPTVNSSQLEVNMTSRLLQGVPIIVNFRSRAWEINTLGNTGKQRWHINQN